MAEFKTNRVATVEILGSEYRLTGDDELYLKQLARYVDSELRSCSEKGMIYSSGRLGILTCLNIADQLFKLKNEQKETLDSVTKLINKVDKVLGYITQNNETQKIEPIEAIHAHN